MNRALLFLLAGGLLFVESLATEPIPVAEEVPNEIEPTPQPEDIGSLGASAGLTAEEFAEVVYEVRIRGYETRTGQAAFYGGTAVAIRGANRFLTAAHIVDGLRPGYQVDIRFPDGWRNNVPFRVIASDKFGADLAEILTEKPMGHGLEMQSPDHLQDAQVFGRLSGLHRGVVADTAGSVSLAADSVGIRSGDSGGPVVQDGRLVGILSGFRSSYSNVPADSRVVRFTPVAGKFEAAQQSPKPQQVQADCPGGVCPVPQARVMQQPRRQPLLGRLFR
jgi:hypothetical protein